jgi:hypothetical protein
MMFDKMALQPIESVLGETTNTNSSISIYGISKDIQKHQQLMTYVATTIVAKITELDESRPIADRNKQVLYRYRAQLNPATCKNSK